MIRGKTRGKLRKLFLASARPGKIKLFQLKGAVRGNFGSLAVDDEVDALAVEADFICEPSAGSKTAKRRRTC